MNASRRRFLAASSALVPSLWLAACAGTPAQQQVTFDKFKSYFDTGAMAVMAAAQAYLVKNPSATTSAIVQQGVIDITKAQQIVDASTLPTNWKAGVLEGLSAIEKLQPILAVIEGPEVAMGVDLAVSVAQAFVQQLPDPAPQQPVPPAALRSMAMRYHHGQ